MPLETAAPGRSRVIRAAGLSMPRQYRARGQQEHCDRRRSAAAAYAPGRRTTGTGVPGRRRPDPRTRTSAERTGAAGHQCCRPVGSRSATVRRASDFPSAPHRSSGPWPPTRRSQLDSQPEVLDLLAHQLGGVAAARLDSHHLDDVFVAEPHDELAVVDPLLPAGPPGRRVEVRTGEDQGEQPGAARVQVVGYLQDLVLAGSAAQVLYFRDDQVCLVRRAARFQGRGSGSP